MKTLRRLSAAIALTLALAFAAFADCEPGQMSTPPCLGAQITPDDPVTSAEPSASSTSSASTVVEISETAIDVLLSALSLF